MNLYQQEILDNFKNPRNIGKPEQFTNSIKLQNLSCGDEIEVFLNIIDGVVQNINYGAEGCAISIASASILSEHLKGKTVNEISELSENDVIKHLGIELTISRIKCAHMALDAIQQAAST